MRDTTRPLPFLVGARQVFALVFEPMLWSGRSAVMALLLGLPMVFAVLFRFSPAATVSALDFYGLLVSVYGVRNVLPLCAFFYGSALIADEVEGRTITYLLTRPIYRGSILAGKFAAYLASTLTLALPPVVIGFLLLASAPGAGGLGANLGALFRDLGVVALTLLVYGALFTLLGVLVRRPLVPGLLFLFIWETAASRLPGYLPRLTIAAWLRALLPYGLPDDGAGGVLAQLLTVSALPAWQALLVLPVLGLGLLGMAALIFLRREYVLDQ
jgi:ABC-2 type transport system permease protein